MLRLLQHSTPCCTAAQHVSCAALVVLREPMLRGVTAYYAHARPCAYDADYGKRGIAARVPHCAHASLVVWLCAHLRHSLLGCQPQQLHCLLLR